MQKVKVLNKITTNSKVLFITLRTFSLTGGVEKVCRGISFALQQMHDAGKIAFQMISLYDKEINENYVNKKNFKGHKGHRIKAMFDAIREGINSDVVIISHINLAPIGLAIKIVKPNARVIVWTHGIEIWRPLNMIKKLFLTRTDMIVAVSSFTAEAVQRLHDTGNKTVRVIHNALDPYFVLPDITDKALQKKVHELRKRYRLDAKKKIFMALTRLRITERDKNYDKVIRLLGELRHENEVVYILCGKYDDAELERIKRIAIEAGMSDNVILTGFVDDQELTAHYLLADAFVLPSVKEGFGLAFMEAQACGLTVIAGNKDGSVEAVKDSEAGILVNPEDELQLKQALLDMLRKNTSSFEKIQIQNRCLQYFSFEEYKLKIMDIVRPLN